eukprot:gb/GECG01016512.1/.p1 GENE.gb/GECG01016512.1/~~gb/GECG01016512.1/.p1  ORF type:complete len:247 (+),score=25.02 gb/GECG01016512.1/:1-741(+)
MSMHCLLSFFICGASPPCSACSNRFPGAVAEFTVFKVMYLHVLISKIQVRSRHFERTETKMTVKSRTRGTMLTALIATLSMMAAESFGTDCGGGYSCPGDDTCCPSSSGPPSCCIFPKATCCSDHVHCCPPSYPICDLRHQRCLSYSNSGEAQAYMKQLIQEMFLEGKKDENGNRLSWLPWFGNMMHTQKLRGNEKRAPVKLNDYEQQSNGAQDGNAEAENSRRIFSIPLMDTMPASRQRYRKMNN